jgi:hypothetical protein
LLLEIEVTGVERWLRSSTYLGTSVIRRFTDAADELLRIDSSTLTVAARTTLAGNVVGLVADAQDVWVALPDRVLRLDRVSLAVRASRVIPGAVAPPGDSSSVSSIALGPAELLVTVGGAGATTLYRFDRTTLSLRGKTDLPLGSSFGSSRRLPRSPRSWPLDKIGA